MKVNVRSSPGDNCEKDHVRSQGVKSYYSALNRADGNDSRVEPCFQCEVYFVKPVEEVKE